MRTLLRGGKTTTVIWKRSRRKNKNAQLAVSLFRRVAAGVPATLAPSRARSTLRAGSNSTRVPVRKANGRDKQARFVQYRATIIANADSFHSMATHPSTLV